jgi:hypothetical protein
VGGSKLRRHVAPVQTDAVVTAAVAGDRFSLLRTSVPARLAMAAAASALLWLAVLWALT